MRRFGRTKSLPEPIARLLQFFEEAASEREIGHEGISVIAGVLHGRA